MFSTRFFAWLTQAQWSIVAVILHTIGTLSATAQVDIGAFLTLLSLEHLLAERIDGTRARVRRVRRRCVIGTLSAEQAWVRLTRAA